jgi:cAMP-dependent protein kinase regulator
MTVGKTLSPLDRAHGLRIAKDSDEALRVAGSLCLAQPDHPGAAQLVARLLLDAGRAMAAGEACERLVDAWIRRGDLGAARIAAEIGLEAGGYAPAAMGQIAEAFGKGSARLADAAAPAPPALPTDVVLAEPFAQASGEALLDAAEQALAGFREAADRVPDDRPLPKLPLFCELPPALLVRLLSLMELRELPAGARVIEQDQQGSEAYLLVRGVLRVEREEASLEATELAILGPGALFGEMALVSDAPRAASVTAVEPVQLLAMPRAGLEQLAGQDDALGRELGAFCHRRMIANLLRHSVVLRTLDYEQRLAVMAGFAPRSFETGEQLIRAGEEAGSLFLIASGSVSVHGRDAEGERVRLAELGPGDVVGEISLVLRRPANADVVARHPTVALELQREPFHALIREHPGLLERLYDIAIQRDELTRSVIGQPAMDVPDDLLL